MGNERVLPYLKKAKAASYSLSLAKPDSINLALRLAAKKLKQSIPKLLEVNQVDLDQARDLSKTALDRLKLDENRVLSMASAVEEISMLRDVVGEIHDGWVRPNGLKISRVRVPLGVIGIVYENRPNVTSDAASLCLKAGNCVVLRGSSSAIRSNEKITELFKEALSDAGLDENCVTLIPFTDRDSVVELVQDPAYIDCIIPRGGKELVNTILENSKVPVVVDGDGNCHLFIDEFADLTKAEEITLNAKLQRPGVCNAIETLLIHEKIAQTFLPTIAKRLVEGGCELFGDEHAITLFPEMNKATNEDFATEYLNKKLAIAIVKNLDGAIEHIRKYSSLHSEAIVTESYTNAQKFMRSVDAACVLVNCSTRFVDGGQFGLGAEIGISTQKLHARGPMGLRELTTLKWVVEGDGQIRS